MQKQRFSGTSKNRTAQLFLDYSKDKGMITAAERKHKLTTVQRFLGNAVFRELWESTKAIPNSFLEPGWKQILIL
jgi:hypothetical protein